ncbi:DEAD/DEAH box helicase family protein [Stenotrophomonas sp. GZD-301]|uniref:DEAD/DEAH box helicase family protein n=1 Tax=Stenotrophomonas sp. GZD-301 TaxID=3404814 RepID=UPI003BB69DB5
MQQGSPHVITAFPTPDSLKSYQKFEPDQKRIVMEVVSTDYIVQTQFADYEKEAGWVNGNERSSFCAKNKLRFLRSYQKRAVNAIQDAIAQGSTRFLFEMATGTGKTLTSAAVIKLFLRTGNARRVLFLVDRLELEDQAAKAFKDYLKNDYATAVYKQRRDDWRKAEIVVTTIQSLLFDNKYRRLFSPTDFDLVISDEAHRSIGGNARAVFEYFVGYKLGLTATPRDYLKSSHEGSQSVRDSREQERRLLLDTYRTFGCDSGQPTFRYSLLDGVKDGYLINPVVLDARTTVTTQLLSEQGYAVVASTSEDGHEEKSFVSKDFEKKFFSPATNELFSQTLIKNGLRDPVTGEFGKSIVFAVSQNHAAKISQILNQIADAMWPGKYQSDFAVQVTSSVPDAQQYTTNFTNNKLLGSANFSPLYKTSKARVCVTVGMMTTGYDCPDLLNLAFMRPIYSPSDFVQMKGRGTRKHNFLEQLLDEESKPLIKEPEKKQFKLLDFFANCEYFEERFDYDEVLKLPQQSSEALGPADASPATEPTLLAYEHIGADVLHHVAEQQIGYDGMKIDRMLFERFEDQVKVNPTLQEHVEAEKWDMASDYVLTHLFEKPNDYFTLEKLRRAAGVDRRLSLKEILQKIFGLIPHFKSKDELVEDEFQEFLLANQKKLTEDQGAAVLAMNYFFKAYATDASLRAIIDNKSFGELNVNPSFGVGDLRAVPTQWREGIPEYIKDYVQLNQFM